MSDSRTSGARAMGERPDDYTDSVESLREMERALRILAGRHVSAREELTMLAGSARQLTMRFERLAPEKR